MSRIVLHFEAAASLGAGHAVRGLALAEALAASGAQCLVATHAATLESVPAAAAYPVLGLDGSNSLAERLRAEGPAGFDGLVVDNYALTDADERACRPFARRILAIDDLPNRRHDADLLLDQTIGREAAAYANLLPPAARVLAGPAYALLRPQFPAWRARSLARRRDSLRRVLISVGATDPNNVTATMLDGLAKAGLPVEVDAVLGRSAPARDAVAAHIARLPLKARLHVQVDEMAELMARADLVLGAAGSSALERCALGLPSLVVIDADNQRDIARNLEAAGACRRLGDSGRVSPGMVARALAALAADAAGLLRMADAAAAICDGNGAARAARAFQEMLGG